MNIYKTHNKKHQFTIAIKSIKVSRSLWNVSGVNLNIVA